ncbi:hypothetical protein F4777DRAFT_555156 [Nemania sp. FL0916]|nr:hypothetical protein F4777DRAFT_555156 [Nemania sp. FL0916]
MQSPPTSSNAADALDAFDSSRPFRGLVLCCTNIEADQRTEIAQRTIDLGGVHKYDLTPDVTHLIVGDYNTAKYRHVAKERPDIKPMAAGWIEAVRRLWVEAKDIDFAALEDSWQLQTFEAGGGSANPDPSTSGHERQRLVCCLTGFEDNDVRAMIEEKVRTNGGEYVADLSRRVTHLIVSKPEGKKYNAARRWDIRCVSIEWLHDSVERGMILNEECYDPTLPIEERGKGAWSRRDPKRTSLGKRTRGEAVATAEGERRKLRKSASMRMHSQSTNIWGDILNQSAGDLSELHSVQREPSAPVAATTIADPVTASTVTETLQTTAQSVSVAQPLGDLEWTAPKGGVFSGCRFFVHGFPAPKEQLLFDFLSSHGGQLSSSLEDVASRHHAELLSQRFLLVPQMSQPDSHPQLPDGVHIVTEFFIERCIHNKTLFSPNDHVWGQPFPRFPIDGFQNLTICTAGFVNEQLNHIEKTVTQLGATYSEKLNRQVSLLICPDLASLREQKRDLAIYHNILIINVEWLWQCITTACLVPWNGFQFDEVTRKADAIRANLKRREEEKKKGRETLIRSRSEPVPPAAKSGRVPAPPPRAGVDMTAFDSGTPGADRRTSPPTRKQPLESQPNVAPTRTRNDDAFTTTPLSETAASHLNKVASPPKQSHSEQTLQRFPTEGEVGDSDAGDESDATTPSTMKEPTANDSEAERKRKAQQAKDLKRLELSKRLNSLMADDATQDGSNLQTGLLPRPARRKREILGRAASNVSAASSASAESSSALSGPRVRQLAPRPTASGESEFDKFFEPIGENSGPNPEHLPPSTQLEYEDPEARKHRQVVERKMMGRGKLPAKSGGGENDGFGDEKLRLADLQASANASRERGAARRTTRRQGR